MKRMNGWAAGIAFGAATLAIDVCLAQASTDLAACTRIENGPNRLKCYDEQMARAGFTVGAVKPAQPPAAAQTSTPTAASTTAAPASAAPALAAARPAAAGTSADFGLEADVVRKKREAESPGSAQPEQLTGRVKAISTRAHGEYRIEMEDGQVWIETLRTGGLPPEPGETVTIKKGTLGSFYLSRRAGVALRVKRVR